VSSYPIQPQVHSQQKQNWLWRNFV
jgi:hypothetical protein